MAACDASTMIAEFSADASQTCLEMPHMTTGQRKETKKLLEAYPELRCVSYGFGAERCLHLFKESHPAAEAEISRSMSPLGISTRIKDAFVDLLDDNIFGDKPITLQSWQEHSDGTGLDVDPTVGLASPKKMGVDSFDGPIQISAQEFSPELILPLTAENLQVRNTFIHMCEAPADERVVQSMPHGMFKQCLLSEAAEAFGGTFFCDTPTSAGGDTPGLSDSDADVVVDHSGQSPPLKAGAHVLVEGLVKLPAYNGRSAVVENWDEVTGRYSVLISCPSGCQQAKVKAGNLRAIARCPC
jgi:hypothetical protein